MDTKILHGCLQPSTGEGVRPSALAILGRNKPSKADNLATAGREGLETGTPSKQCVPCTTSWSTGRPVSFLRSAVHRCDLSRGCSPPPRTHTLLGCLACAPTQGGVFQDPQACTGGQI